MLGAPKFVIFVCSAYKNFSLFRQLLKCVEFTFSKPSASHHKDEPSATVDLACVHNCHQRFQCSDVNPVAVFKSMTF